MRLDGRLEDFSLPDVLQLLASTHKSGALLLDGSGPSQAAPRAVVRRGVIRLGSGAVNGASSDLGRHSLARRLVGSGRVSDDALERAAQDVRRGAPSLVRALLDRAELPASAVTDIAAEHATDAVCELLRWEAGGFSFRIGEPDPDGLELGLPTGDLMAEGERRRHEWLALTSHIPSPDTVLRLSTAPAVDPSCTREEWGLLALVDGARTVAEIVALLGRGEFAVAGALAALVDRGLLTASSNGSGLAELQRRQAVITALESPAGEPPAAGPVIDSPVAESPAAPSWAPVPMGDPADAATADAAIADAAPADAATADAVPAAVSSAGIPLARTETAAFGEAGSPAPQPAFNAVSSPPTSGALALGPEISPERAPEPVDRPLTQPTIRGLDSAVTKSLVLRLIAGVREL